METHVRTLVKAVSWRIGGSLLSAAIAWAVTRQLAVAAAIGLLDTGVKIVGFYIHERLWLKIKFGLAGR